jgi:hypothetical protein
MATGALQSRPVPDLFHKNPIRSSVLSLFPVFLELENFLNFSQHFKMFGSQGMAVGALKSREFPDVFYANSLRSTAFSLFLIFLELKYL